MSNATATVPILAASKLDVYYGQSRILRQVDVAFQPGSITAIMGRNGVGKTTLLKSLAGILTPKTGTIAIAGRDVTRLRPDQRARLGLGYVPQGREIFPKLTVYENLMMGLEARADGVRELQDDFVYDLFPVLAKMDDRLGGNLSGGQQQQLAIARALLGEPKVLLLDEPTEGVQPSIILDIERALLRLKARGNLAIVLVEQYLDFAQRLADHFYLMDRGAVVHSGVRADLTDDHIRQYLTF